MNRRGLSLVIALAFASSALLLPFASAAQIRFTDDGGRQISLPAQVDRIIPAGPPASTDLLILAPQKLLGLTNALTGAQAAFLPAAAARLPAIGRLTGRGNTVNLEQFLKSRPDLAVDVGYVSGSYLSLADRVQSQTGVPYALIGGRLRDTPVTLRRLGALVGAAQRAEALVQYAQSTLDALSAGLAKVPATQRPRVYIARGPRGLETGVAGSINSEALELVGAQNVATPSLGSRGLADVSLEQVLAWRPDVIIALDPVFYKAVWSDPGWRQLASSVGRSLISPSRSSASFRI